MNPDLQNIIANCRDGPWICIDQITRWRGYRCHSIRNDIFFLPTEAKVVLKDALTVFKRHKVLCFNNNILDIDAHICDLLSLDHS
jgi:hypothetical protein